VINQLPTNITPREGQRTYSCI